MATKKNLSVLVNVRGNLINSLTKTASFTENISDTDSKEILEVRMEQLDELWSKFNKSQEQIYAFDGVEGYVDPDDGFEQFESKYIAVKSVLLSEIRKRQNNTTNVSSAATDTKPNACCSHQDNQVDHLPKIYIEPFPGTSYQDWPAFRDMFLSAIHKKQSLSPIQKFHLLRSHLRGQALNLISQIPMSDVTYDQAWERLEKRYNRPRFIINSLLETFMHQPTLQSSNIKSLRKISDVSDEIVRSLDSFKSVGRDPWMIHILINKVDQDTRQAWSTESLDIENPTINQFLTFLERRCEALESCKGNVRESKEKSSSFKTLHVTSSNQCPKCKKPHLLFQCPDFLSMTTDNKRDFVKSNRLCFNCLRSGHNSANCQSKSRCKTCNSRHHSLVHIAISNSNIQNSTSESITTAHPLYLSPIQNANPYISHHSLYANRSLSQTLLPTAVGKILDVNGNYQLVRILIDSGSQVSFITEACAQRLGLKRTNARIPISGIGGSNSGQSRGLVSINIVSCYHSTSIAVETFILSTITTDLPAIPFNIQDWEHISNLNLADPLFYQPGNIDILLGADKVWDILENERIRSSKGHPIAQKTIFGWVMAGKLVSGSNENIQSLHSTVDIDSILQSFWTIEEVDSKLKGSKEVEDIEDHFAKTHRRNTDGKYTVKLPFKKLPVFGDTVRGAISRLTAMERKFLKDDSLYRQYSKFMDEYLSLGHMVKIPSSEISKSNVYYLPHHAVLKLDSPTTKLRVVFDGSFKDTNGNSLNDSLMIGPPIQRNLFSVSIRLRRHKFVFTADIVKMFRQIWVAPEDTDFQRIVWRKSPTDPLEHFRLCTVTYGTACAPYQSVRVLEQLANDYQKDFPVAADILLNDFYVDDVASGGDSLPDAIFKINSLIDLLRKGGLQLSKWQSNCKQILPPGDPNIDQDISIGSDSDSVVKVLGLYWNSKLDTFSFHLNITPNEPLTKRQILKEVARIFDPLGFLAPSVVQLKIIFQELWHLKLDWDEPLPICIALKWCKYRDELPLLTNIRIPRFIGIINSSFQLHGFSDASSSAYSAVIYARFISSNGTIKTNIVAAKTRVAPLKQLTIPRLELCGALLLARLMDSVQKSLNTKFTNIYAWCDSKVVLSWLSSPPRRWEIFIGNRCSEILDTIPRNRWFHIRSAQNPADCASRGILPSALVKHPIWWTGPQWLTETEDQWPIIRRFEEHPDCKQEEKKQYLCSYHIIALDDYHPIAKIASRVSSWYRLIRAVAFVYRVRSRFRKQLNEQSLYIRPYELFNAKREIIKWLQYTQFRDDIEFQKKHGHFPKNSKIINLSPFFDSDGILRVGGRIEEAHLSFNVKHPIIIPKGHDITKLLVADFHERYLHTGVSTLFILIRQEYWILGCRNLLRKFSHKCIRCFKQKKNTATQIMGNLPGPRIQQSRPFTHCGVDYAGPILIKTKIGRKTTTTKGYISLFVCLSTKAIHLELVSDLTSDAFLAALRRFVARRGRPSHMYSDNGTNFHGSAKKLTDMHRITLSEQHNSLIGESLARESITWHFIPPSTPHFGGLWEAGVKSVKQHLHRVIGADILSFEDLYTLLTQIEALLNSRPLCLKSDNDFDPLTPAHFIIGESYSAVPEPSLTHIPQNRLSNWQSLQSKIQGYWKRWSMEYITSLQQRPRWTQHQRDFQLNDLVLIKEPNLPPGKWAMGRVVKTHPGVDGHVRVVTLRTTHGNFLRPIHKLALLPLS